MKRTLYISKIALRKIADALKTSAITEETGGLLLGYHGNNKYLIFDVTVPIDTVSDDIESLERNGLKFDIVGFWHFHTNEKEILSEKEKKLYYSIGKKLGGITVIMPRAGFFGNVSELRVQIYEENRK